MAEVVELRREQMLPQLEQMKRIRLLEEKEIDQIKKKRERFEYKLLRQKRSLNDYLSYITYEKTLLLFIRERRKSRKIFEKKSSIDNKITTTIYHLYSKALSRFSEDVATWDSFIKFCVESKLSNRISAIWDKYILYHADKAEVWMKAGLWEWKEGKNIARAISFISRGIQRHPKCAELYILYINTELNGSKQLSSEMELKDGMESEQTLAMKRVEIIYRQFLKEDLANRDNLEELKEITLGFDLAADLNKQIENDLKRY